MTVQEQTETLSFQAEVSELLHLVAHALYSNKEIFLRELISNASDANDKLRYAALTDNALYENQSDLKIWVDFDEANQTVTITDNGIGMTRDEVIENLGTIAKSGTKAFREMLTSDAAKDSQLIGQFGVGFYSAYIVADKVVVKTRRAGTQADQGVYWESQGKGEFTIKNIDKESRGTEIILYIKPEAKEFLDAVRLRTIIHKYSDHILFPILMKKIEKTAEEKTSEAETPQVTEEIVNRANALWALPKEQIKDEEYNELYRHISHDFSDPLAWTHNRVEGSLEYINLLFLPARAPFDLYNRDLRRGIKLYVKRVFIMDDAEQLMPLYLRFVKGIVDSNDLPLNISRELLQSDKTIERIRSGCVKRVLDLLEKLAAENKEKYTQFWQSFGQVMKEGPGEDVANRDRIAKLLRFSSTFNDNENQDVSLDDYIARLKPSQDKIYYIIADNFTAAKNNPLLEVFRKKNLEVLLMHEKVDEWLMGHLYEYAGKSFQSVSRGGLDLNQFADEEEKKQQQEKANELGDVLKQIKEILSGQVKDVRISQRLINSPVCVVFDEMGMTGHMQRLLKAAGQSITQDLPILEINPNHALIEKIKQEANPERIARWSEILLGQALLAEGEQLQDPSKFVQQLNELLLG